MIYNIRVQKQQQQQKIVKMSILRHRLNIRKNQLPNTNFMLRHLTMITILTIMMKMIIIVINGIFKIKIDRIKNKIIKKTNNQHTQQHKTKIVIKVVIINHFLNNFLKKMINMMKQSKNLINRIIIKNQKNQIKKLIQVIQIDQNGTMTGRTKMMTMKRM